MTETQQSSPTKPQFRLRRRYKILIALFLILAGGFIAWRMYANHEVETRLAAIRAAGYPVTPVELDAWYPQVPPEENAAIVLLEAFQYFVRQGRDMDNLPVCGDAMPPVRSQPMPPEMTSAIADYLELNKAALPLLHKGAALPQSRYPVDLSKGYDTLLPHLGMFRMGIKLLYLEALLNAEEGRSEAASEDIVSMLGVARSLEKEPLLISQLVRIACNVLAHNCLERLLNQMQFTDVELIRMSQAFEQAEKYDGLQRGLVGAVNSRYDIYQHPKKIDMVVRNVQNPSPSSGLGLDWIKDLIRTAGRGGHSFLYRNSGFLQLDYCRYLEHGLANVEACKLPLPQRLKVANEINKKLKDRFPENRKNHFRAFIDVIPNQSRVFLMDARGIAEIRNARVALAVERYRRATGELPLVLDELVPTYLAAVPIDPFDPAGRTVKYKTLEQGYCVYSVGEDEQDNGGTEKDAYGRKFEAGTDIPFIVETLILSW
jgi:hypothetical protein